jgi:Na+/phosphate symporter
MLVSLKRAALWAIGIAVAGSVIGGTLAQLGIIDESRREPLVNVLVSIAGIVFVLVFAADYYRIGRK